MRFFHLCQLLDSESFAAQYEFVYMPANFKTMASFGIAFVSFREQAIAECARRHFHRFCWNFGATRAILEVEWSKGGTETFVERFRDCPVMHNLVPREFKPLLLRDGLEVRFPAPRTNLQPPPEFRRRRRSQKGSGARPRQAARR